MSTGTTIGWDQDIFIPERDANNLENESMVLINNGSKNKGERRIFTIPVGNLTPEEAEKFLKEVQEKLKRKPNE